MSNCFVTLYKLDLIEKKNIKKNISTISFVEKNLEFQAIALFESLKKAHQSYFVKEIDALELYLFKYKNALFFLITGETITVSGWNSKVQQKLEKIINKINNENEKVIITDHTYSQARNSRRIRSLGGGLRRLLSVIKIDNEFLTNKEIIKNLEYFVILGNKKKLVTQIFAVEKNTKFNYEIKPKFTDLPLDQFLVLAKSIIFQHFSNGPEADAIQLIDDFQKDMKKEVDKLKNTFCC